MRNKQNIGILLAAALLLLLLPLRWLTSALIAALIHELGHYCATRLTGGSIHCLRFGLNGAVMEVSGLDVRSELISLLAGPIAGLFPLLTLRMFPSVAICGVVQSIYNLFPIYPLDGGRILYRIIQLKGGTERCFHIIEYSFLFFLTLLCIFIHLRLQISLFLFLVPLLFRKTPCKRKKDWI